MPKLETQVVFNSNCGWPWEHETWQCHWNIISFEQSQFGLIRGWEVSSKLARRFALGAYGCINGLL